MRCPDFVPFDAGDVGAAALGRAGSTAGRANPVGVRRLVMRFFDGEAMHSTVRQAGFKQMGEDIATERTTPG
jgi:hypothetical protein